MSHVLSPTCTEQIRLNSLGFLPDQRKQASVTALTGQFSVVETGDNRTVYTGVASGPETDTDSGHTLWTLDFSGLKNEGTYRLMIEDVGISAPFTVSSSLYNFSYYTVSRAMYLWRCGTAVAGTHNGIHFSHLPCHMDDGIYRSPNGEEQYRNGVGGWHDAGDYNKYTLNAGITVGAMLLAWEHFGSRLNGIALELPESGHGIPDLLAEVKWEIEWLLKMQHEDGRVAHKLSTKEFCGFIMPEKESGSRLYTDWTSASTASFVAQTAMTARVLAPYDSKFAARCLSAAKTSYKFLQDHPEDFNGDMSGFHTGGYRAPDESHRLWASAELWEATGENSYLVDLERQISSLVDLVDVAWDWQNCKNLGLFTYLSSDRGGRDEGILLKVQESLIAAADTLVQQRENSGYRRPMGSYYHWGGNGTQARQTITLYLAGKYNPNPEYVETALDAISYLFGRNPYGRSFVTGLGHHPPMYPHDRRAGADGIVDPWPGYLVGGAWPSATDWTDSEEDYRTNEIAINWNGALIYALAQFAEPNRESF